MCLFRRFSPRFAFSLQILAWCPAGFHSGSSLGSLLGLCLALHSTRVVLDEFRLPAEYLF